MDNVHLFKVFSFYQQRVSSLFEKINEQNTHDTREGGEEIGGSIAEKDENV